MLTTPGLLESGVATTGRTQAWEGKLYLGTVIDLYSRRGLPGWAIAEHCKATLVCDAL
jgi:hypothetical protein